MPVSANGLHTHTTSYLVPTIRLTDGCVSVSQSKKAVSKAVEEHRAAVHLSSVAAERKGPHFTDMDRARLRVVRAQEARRQVQ